jgi:hypothetical protein
MWQSCLGCCSCMGWPWIPASTGWFGYLHNCSKTWFLWRECSNILTYPVRLPLLLKTGSLAKTGHSKAVSLFKLAACVLNLPSPHHQLLMSTFRTRLVFMLWLIFCLVVASAIPAEVPCRLTSGAQGLGIQSEEGRSSELFDVLEVEIHLSFKCFSG